MVPPLSPSQNQGAEYRAASPTPRGCPSAPAHWYFSLTLKPRKPQPAVLIFRSPRVPSLLSSTVCSCSIFPLSPSLLLQTSTRCPLTIGHSHSPALYLFSCISPLPQLPHPNADNKPSVGSPLKVRKITCIPKMASVHCYVGALQPSPPRKLNHQHPDSQELVNIFENISSVRFLIMFLR